MERITIVFALFAASGALGVLPNGWKACSRSSDDYTNCLKREIKFAISTLIDGDKKLGTPPLDPLMIESMVMPQYPGPVSLSLNFSNVAIKGFKDLEVMEIEKNDWTKTTAQFFAPNLQFVGDYKVEGKVLILPIKGQGKSNITHENLNLGVEIYWKEVEKNGKKYFMMDKVLTSLKAKKYYVDFGNLFNGDKALGDNMNKFINENWDQIMVELKTPIDQAMTQVLTVISNRIMSHIPAEEVDI